MIALDFKRGIDLIVISVIVCVAAMYSEPVLTGKYLRIVASRIKRIGSAAKRMMHSKPVAAGPVNCETKRITVRR